MKYWVFQDSRILGPFDQAAVAELPGVDASTLVCAGEPAADGGDWRPAGEISGLALPPVSRPAWPSGEEPSTFSLLGQLEIETAAVLGDDSFPGAAQTLFEDADVKRAFSETLAPRPSVDEAELRKAKDRVVELTTHLELLYKRVSELEAGQTSLVHRLAEKELLLRRQPPPPPPPTLKQLLKQASDAPAVPDVPVAAPAPAPPIVASAPIPPVPATPPAPVVPAAAVPVLPEIEAAAPPVVPIPPVPAPVLPPAPPAAELSVPAAPAAPKALFERKTLKPAEEAPAAPKPMFERKTLKPALTIKTFRVVGAEAPAAPVEPVALPPAPAAPEPVVEAAPPPPTPALPPAPAPVSHEPTPSAPAPAAFGWGVPAAAPASAPQVISLAPAAPEPPAAAAPPETLKFGSAPAPETGVADFAFGAADAAAFTESAAGTSTQQVLARLAKPEPAPATSAPRAPRSNKTFAIGGVVLVAALGGLSYFFLRQPKELKQMAELDDGRARLGAEPVDDARRPAAAAPAAAPAMPPAAPAAAPTAPAATVPVAAPAAAPAPAAESVQAASQAALEKAVAFVKDYPLAGGRENVSQWLQYSYSGSPDAGQESWNASQTADKTYLVEYRFVPSAPGAAEVHYLFEADPDREYVVGKTLDAKRMLAGGISADEKPRAKAAKPKPKSKKKPARPKTPAKRAARKAAPPPAAKAVPLLPLPNEGELQPPAEDDGAFRSDTVGSDL